MTRDSGSRPRGETRSRLAAKPGRAAAKPHRPTLSRISQKGSNRMTTDFGRSPVGSGSRASHEVAGASSPKASIPNACPCGAEARIYYSTTEEISICCVNGAHGDRRHPKVIDYAGLRNPQETIRFWNRNRERDASAIEARQRQDREAGPDPKGESAVRDSADAQDIPHD